MTPEEKAAQGYAIERQSELDPEVILGTEYGTGPVLEDIKKLYPQLQLLNCATGVRHSVEGFNAILEVAITAGINHERTRHAGMINAALACLENVDHPKVGIVKSLLQAAK